MSALAAATLATVSESAAQARPARVASATRGAPSASEAGTCVLHSLPSFTDQGAESVTATVADVVEVECAPTVYGTGSKIRITANQLYARCKDLVSWYVANPFRVESDAPGVSVELDADGNATVALRAGPGCSPGESLISAHLEEEPFETFTTSFSVEPPEPTKPGVFAIPAAQVEDAESSGVATVVQAEFEDGSEQHVHISAEELYHRCRVAPHLHWVLMNGEIESETAEVSGVELDGDGNAFVIALGDRSCAPGPSLIEADLEAKPFTTFTSEFTIQPPQPTGEPTFTIQKLQEVAGGGGGFTTFPLRADAGQTVDYEVVVRNTGYVPVTFGELTDAHCDGGTLTGGPGSSPVAPGQSTSWTCDHTLTGAGTYLNEATITGNSMGGSPVTETSNVVVVEVPPPAFSIEKLQMIAGAGGEFTTAPLKGSIGETVDYEIVVENTGGTPLVFSGFSDPRCDTGTVAGGPGETPVAVGSSTTFTCSHVLTVPGTYFNEAHVTGTAQGEAPKTRGSNQVEVEVAEGMKGFENREKPGQNEEKPTQEEKPANEETPAKEEKPTQEVLSFCATRVAALHGASGPKRGTFAVQINAAGIKKITFYLDGRKVVTLAKSQAKGGRFTLEIDPRKLSYGAHKVSIKAVMGEAACASVVRSGVFVRPRSAREPLKFTG